MSDKDTIAALQRNLAAAEVERLRLVAEVERLRFELEQAQTGVLNANEQVSELRAEVERLCNRLGDKSEATSAALADAFTKGTLAAGDAMRERLASSEAEVERLREALRDIASGDYSDPLCMRTPEERARMALVTEDE